MRGEEFYNWISASHKIFEVFEINKEVYDYCLIWVNEYFEKGIFTVTNNMKNNLLEGVSNLHIKNKDIENVLKLEYRRFIVNLPKNNDKLAFAFAPYLMFWNVIRFEYYFKKDKNFDLIRYFDNLNENIGEFNTIFKILRKRHILDDNIDKKSVKILLGNLNKRLKNLSPVKQNEYIMAIKILHIIAPYYLPLLDGYINYAFNIEIFNKKFNKNKNYKPVSIADYLNYTKFVKEFLLNYYLECKRLENKFGLSILKLLDEAFYIRYSRKWFKYIKYHIYMDIY